MNVRKLRKLQRWILAEPRRFDMKHWSGDRELVSKQNPPCGTVGCLAGMTCHMEGIQLREGTGYLGSRGHVSDKAASILKLNDRQSSNLFYLESIHGDTEHHWPRKFERAYLKAKTLKGRARVAVRRIEHFIKTKGME